MKYTKKHMEIISIINDKLALLRPNSERSYRVALQQFIELLFKKRLCLERARGEHILQYLAMLKERGASDNTIHARLEALRSIFGTLHRLEYYRSNIAEQVRDLIPARQHRQVQPTAILTPENVEEIRSAPSANTKDGIRDRAILCTIFGGGLRHDEVRKLDLRDVMVSPLGTLHIIIRGAKAGEDQRQALSTWAAKNVSVLVSQRKAEGATNAEPLFIFYYQDGKCGKRLSYSTIGRIFKKWATHCGVSAAPHAGRAAYATSLKRLGFEDRDVGGALRHSGEAQVRIYDKRVNHVDTSPALSLDYKKLIATQEEKAYK